MARRKAAENGDASRSDQASNAGRATTPVSRDVIKVNNANLTELKHTLDDTLKRVRGAFLKDLRAST